MKSIELVPLCARPTLVRNRPLPIPNHQTPIGPPRQVPILLLRTASVTYPASPAVPLWVHGPSAPTPNTENQRENTPSCDRCSLSLWDVWVPNIFSGPCPATSRLADSKWGSGRMVLCGVHPADVRLRETDNAIACLLVEVTSDDFRTWGCRTCNDNFSLRCTISHRKINMGNDKQYPRDLLSREHPLARWIIPRPATVITGGGGAGFDRLVVIQSASTDIYLCTRLVRW